MLTIDTTQNNPSARTFGAANPAKSAKPEPAGANELLEFLTLWRRLNADQRVEAVGILQKYRAGRAA